MLDCFAAKATAKTVPVYLVTAPDLKRWLRSQSKAVKAWVATTGFMARPYEVCVVGSGAGTVDAVIVGDEAGPWAAAAAAERVPAGRYVIRSPLSPEAAHDAAVGWALACYRYDRYKKIAKPVPQLVLPESADEAAVIRMVDAVSLVRDLINTPAEDLGPAEMATVASRLAKQHGARCTVLKGEQLLDKNYPTIHAVGRASSRPPHLIDLRWGSSRHPRVTLVGKGVCFDSGGLDLKPSGSMKLMKKDMGGAAHVLGLAHLIMGSELPISLRVLIPAVDNAVSGDAYRPLDVITTRKGLTVEVGNTDAEGRLVLADALAEAVSEEPTLIIDFATLTGAARVALGADIPVLFTNRDAIADELAKAAAATRDPLWRLPLHAGYRRQIDSQVADLSNIGATSYGGAITAALFLQEFVGRKTAWAHFDLMGWNIEQRPGRPVGGEAMALRAVHRFLRERHPAAS